MNSIIAAMIAVTTPQVAPTPTTPAITAPAQSEGGQPQARERRYCVMNVITGSRIERKTCRTRQAWLAQGFDPLAPDR